MGRGRKPLSIETKIERLEKQLEELKALRDGAVQVEPVKSEPLVEADNA